MLLWQLIGLYQQILILRSGQNRAIEVSRSQPQRLQEAVYKSDEKNEGEEKKEKKMMMMMTIMMMMIMKMMMKKKNKNKNKNKKKKK